MVNGGTFSNQQFTRVVYGRKIQLRDKYASLLIPMQTLGLNWSRVVPAAISLKNAVPPHLALHLGKFSEDQQPFIQ